jgi:16S rRNA (cytosine1402-N4)-methyltransferase
MTREITGALRPEKGDVIVDCTVGCGGHAKEILRKIVPHGRLIGLDVDDYALEEARKTLAGYTPGSYVLKKANFGDIDITLKELGVTEINGALFDLGLSSLQLDDAKRGFSMQKDGPLDMRMDPRQHLTASELVNRADEKTLYSIIKEYGEERYAGRIARAIVSERKKSRINRTIELSKIIEKAAGAKYRKQKIHPATRTFQGIRIAVNGELDRLRDGLGKILKFMKPGSRICVISFHSLEDRIVKNIFRENAHKGGLELVTKKPLLPAEEEIKANPRARSAKLRIAESKGS